MHTYRVLILTSTLTMIFVEYRAQDCGKTKHTDYMGQVTSPGFPNPYASRLNCTYDLKASGQNSFKILFDTVDLGACSSDWVEIWCSQYFQSRQRICHFGEIRAVSYARCNHVMIQFRTGGSVSGKGFRLSYAFQPVVAVQLNNTRSSNPKEGRLEIFYNGTWGTVCDDGFTNANARVVCASLGFGYTGTLVSNSNGSGSGPIWLADVSCLGTEQNIDECMHSAWGSHNCSNFEVVSISCVLGVRLNNTRSSNPKEGRLEIFYNGTWGTVCDDGFTHANARVACASLGFGYIGLFIGNSHGAGRGQIWLDNVQCAGTEDELDSCWHRGLGIHNCGHYEDVSIDCSTGCGRTEYNDTIGYFSSPHFPYVYGGNLDCNYSIKRSGQDSVTIIFPVFALDEQHSRYLGGYRYQCVPEDDWVEIKCNHWDNRNARLYCGKIRPPVLEFQSCDHVLIRFYRHFGYRSIFQLTYGFKSAVSEDEIAAYSGVKIREHFGHNVTCPGSSRQCNSSRLPCTNGGLCCEIQNTTDQYCMCRQGYGWMSHVCRNEYISWSQGNYEVIKNQLLRARLTNTRFYSRNTKDGRLEVYHNETWGNVCADGFTDANARVACASLGFGYVGSFIGNSHGSGSGQIWLSNVQCAGTESGLDNCTHGGFGGHDCNHHEDVSISCNNREQSYTPWILLSVFAVLVGLSFLTVISVMTYKSCKSKEDTGVDPQTIQLSNISTRADQVESNTTEKEGEGYEHIQQTNSTHTHVNFYESLDQIE